MWRDNRDTAQSPVVIGGLGGSGTRVAAQLLQECNYYIGSYLNQQLDNLWFTFLMRRPATIRSFNSKQIAQYLQLFDSVMKSYWGKSFKARTQLYEIAAEFMLHNYVKRSRYRFPLHAVRSISQHHYHSEHLKWGFKEPNSHLFIEALHNKYPTMKFVLILRHPLDMVFGHNYNQLYNWHHLFKLPKPNRKNENVLMLDFYNLAYSRAITVGKSLLGENFKAVKIEDLSSKPETLNDFLHFIEADLSSQQLDYLKSIPVPQATFGRYKKRLHQTDLKKAITICKQFNYEIDA